MIVSLGLMMVKMGWRASSFITWRFVVHSLSNHSTLLITVSSSEERIRYFWSSGFTYCFGSWSEVNAGCGKDGFYNPIIWTSLSVTSSLFLFSFRELICAWRSCVCRVKISLISLFFSSTILAVSSLRSPTSFRIFMNSLSTPAFRAGNCCGTWARGAQ